MAGARTPRLAISGEPCLNPKKKKSPKYETYEAAQLFIPGRRKAANPESRPYWRTMRHGFRVRAFSAPRSDRVRGGSMKPAAFRYHAPRTVDEAVALLAEVAPEDGRVLAGGQSLVPIMAFRLARPGHLVDINGVDGLRAITAKDGKLLIGAGVRHAA